MAWVVGIGMGLFLLFAFPRQMGVAILLLVLGGRGLVDTSTFKTRRGPRIGALNGRPVQRILDRQAESDENASSGTSLGEGPLTNQDNARMIMRTSAIGFSFGMMLATAAWSETPSVPENAKQLTGAEIEAWLDGKSLSVEIFDAGVPITATTNWDLGRQRVSGDFVANGQKGTFDNEWVIQGDTSCADKTADGDWICQQIFILDNMMFEVNQDGQLHAVSTVK